MTLFPLPGFMKPKGTGYCAEYQAVYDAFTNKPSDADAIIQNVMLKALVDGSYYVKAEFLDVFSTHIGGSLLNWKSPGVFDPTLMGSPTFREYAGYVGVTNGSVNLNFIPSIDKILSDRNDICIISGVYTWDNRNLFGNTGDFVGAISSNTYTRLSIRPMHGTGGNAYFRANMGSGGNIPNTDCIKYFALSRGASDNFDSYQNKVKSNIVANSNGEVDVSLHTCGYNNSGVQVALIEYEIPFVFVFSYLTETEVDGVIDIMDAYLKNYHTNLIDYDKYVAFGDYTSKVQIPLTTYDGSGETVHPSVINIGSVWNGYQYWMANMPYPGSDASFEKLCIWASSDGITWVVPPGITNPVIPAPGSGNYADNDLFYNSIDDKLYLVWVWAGVDPKVIMMSSSSDGAIWSTPIVVSTAITGETECVSPSLIKIGSKYYIYFFTYLTTQKNNNRTLRVSCDTIDGTYGNRETINLPVIYDKVWWHHDIIFTNGAYYFSGLSSDGGMGHQIFIMKSTDGINFEKNYYPTVFQSGNLYESSGFYRPSLAMIGTQATLYYGTNSNLAKWGCAKINVTLY